MKVFNSLSGKLEEFKPISPKKVTIYVCGITPYDTTHLGHGFTYISFDVLIRYLKFLGFEVIYTQNVTDINDRDSDILQRAKKQNISWDKLAEFWTKRFLEDMEALNWVFPSHFLKASNHIVLMIRIIKALIDKKLAYQRNDSVYLDLSKFPDYGKLSKLNNEEMIKVSRDFEEDLDCIDKKNPLDITLWRARDVKQPLHIPYFDSPFGQGRPGWHIECSAIALSTLSEQTISGERTCAERSRSSRTIDIHGGGIDLKFPHHEAEIAQSEGATGKVPFAKYWIHTGHVHYKGEKMSKSKGNLVMVSDLLKKYSSNAIRWLLLSHHWSKQWEFTEDNLAQAQKNVEIVESTILSKHPESNHIVIASTAKQSSSITEKFTEIMDNNLNTPEALQFLLKLSKQNSKELKRLYEVLGFKIPS